MAVVKPTPVPTPTGKPVSQTIYKPQTTTKATNTGFIGPVKPAGYVAPVPKPVGTPAPRSGSVLGTSSNSAPSYDFGQNIQSPSDPFNGGPSELDQINNEFNSFNSFMDQQESQSKANFSETQGLYDTQKTNATNQLAGEKATGIADIKSQSTLDLKKVRQLLSELQQGNAARTAISGGGSVSEVLGERFGREAQSRMGNVMDTAQKSTERVNTFYNNAITKLSDTYNANILQAKQSLQDTISNISYQRTQSASAKQRGTIDAWKNYYSQVNQAKIQAQTFKAQYDLWKQQNDATLASTSGFNQANQDSYNTGASDSLSDVSQAPGITTESNQYNPFYYVKPKKTPEEELVTPFSSLFDQSTGATSGNGY